MGIKIGGIDVAQSAVDSEFRIMVLEKILEVVLNKIGGTAVLDQNELEKIRKDAFDTLAKKYPDLGLHKKS